MKKLGLIVVALFFFLLVPSAKAATDTIYLTDTLLADDNLSALYSVTFEDLPEPKANLTLLTNFEGFNHVDVMAAGLDGETLYLIDDGAISTKKLFTYDVLTNTYSAGMDITGMGVVDPSNNIDQAAMSPTGVMYITSVQDDKLWTIDTTTAMATLVGEIRRDNNNALVNVQGGDLVFTATGDLYMWTSGAPDADAPPGLYILTIPGAPGDVMATFLGPVVQGNFYTGLAMTENGEGLLLGSDSTDDNVSILNLDGTVVQAYKMFLAGALRPYRYTFGDMTSVLLEPEVLACTYTQGYWMTHSVRGPAPYDDAWANLPLEENTILDFGPNPDLTWYAAFLTAPSKGNPYFILAHQYMAAKLNILDGDPSTPEVDAAIAYAELFFLTYNPNSTFSKQVKTEATFNASILDQYNNGLIGPGHCVDEILPLL